MCRIINLGRDWVVGRQLNSGGFGTVYLAQSLDHRPESAVVKLVPNVPGAEREFLFEDLKGVPNVVPVIDRGEWEDYLALVMPKADKSLREYSLETKRRLSVDDAVRVLVDIGQALVAIEGRIVHRDIKPENILLLNGRWCLADFGISRYADATTAPDTRKYALSSPYAAPEQWRGERASSRTDVYAAGVVAYELLTGALPFPGPVRHDYRRQHLEEMPTPISGIPPRLKALIDSCLYKRPEARPSPQALLDQLDGGAQATSDSARRLQEANALSVQKQAELVRQESIVKSASKRRWSLGRNADQSLRHIISLLDDHVLSNAPSSQHKESSQAQAWTLGEATLSVKPSDVIEEQLDGLPFDVIASSSIILRIQRDRYGYEGRSHSLWYCDAKDEGVFRWYETAFMISPVVPQRSSLDPFALSPNSDAALALSITMHSYQVAWPFSPIDQGNETKFIDRWLGWFADAAQGRLSHPRQMPERDPKGTWRR